MLVSLVMVTGVRFRIQTLVVRILMNVLITATIVMPMLHVLIPLDPLPASVILVMLAMEQPVHQRIIKVHCIFDLFII